MEGVLILVNIALKPYKPIVFRVNPKCRLVSFSVRKLVILVYEYDQDTNRTLGNHPHTFI